MYFFVYRFINWTLFYNVENIPILFVFVVNEIISKHLWNMLKAKFKKNDLDEEDERRKK